MLVNKLRHQCFWMLDALKGHRIKNHLDHINDLLNKPNSSTSIALRQKSIENLLSHAVSHTEFYKSYVGLNVLQDFPVISKSIVQNNFEQFQSKAFIDKDNHKVSTSGSTGLSFFLFQNKDKRLRNYADNIYFYGKANYKLGNPLYKIIVWHSNNRKSRKEAWIQNMTQFDVSKFTQNRIEELVNMLQNDPQKNKVILCYASALEMLAKHIEKHNLAIKNHGVNSIIAISEYLNTYTKETLEQYLGIPVLSRYSNEEMGIMAQQTIESPDVFKINHASYVVEILELDSDKHVSQGEFGRIVVTDLYNYAMPMLRYDTGDIARYNLDAHGVMQLTEIEGRKMDVIYNTQGDMMSSFITHAIFNNYYKDLQQYQFIQQDEKTYEVKLNIKGDRFNFESDLISTVKSEIGSDANVKVSYVNEIPTLASGKRRKVINNYVC